MYRYLKKYLEENYSNENYYFINDFSYIVEDKEGRFYKSQKHFQKMIKL
jgi:hypothetical protein